MRAISWRASTARSCATSWRRTSRSRTTAPTSRGARWRRPRTAPRTGSASRRRRKDSPGATPSGSGLLLRLVLLRFVLLGLGGLGRILRGARGRRHGRGGGHRGLRFGLGRGCRRGLVLAARGHAQRDDRGEQGVRFHYWCPRWLGAGGG